MISSATFPKSSGHQILALAGWLALCFAAPGTAVFVSVDGWHAGLNKPQWNPPNWVFAPAWTLLYAMMAVAAWLGAFWRVRKAAAFLLLPYLGFAAALDLAVWRLNLPTK